MGSKNDECHDSTNELIGSFASENLRLTVESVDSTPRSFASLPCEALFMYVGSSVICLKSSSGAALRLDAIARGFQSNLPEGKKTPLVHRVTAKLEFFQSPEKKELLESLKFGSIFRRTDSEMWLQLLSIQTPGRNDESAKVYTRSLQDGSLISFFPTRNQEVEVRPKGTYFVNGKFFYCTSETFVTWISLREQVGRSVNGQKDGSSGYPILLYRKERDLPVILTEGSVLEVKDGDIFITHVKGFYIHEKTIKQE